MYQNILFWNGTLHVSDGLSVHHQEFKTVQTATGICQTISVWQMPVAVYTVLNSWWWTERPSETCRVSFQNKIILYIGASGWFYYRDPYVCHFNITRVVLYVDNMSCHRQHLSCSENNCLTLPALQSLITIIIKSEHETFSRACLYLNIWSSQGIAQVY